jgi:hypothetical protein
MKTLTIPNYKDIPIEKLCELASTHLSCARTLEMLYIQTGKQDYTDVNEFLRLANEVLDEILKKLPPFITPIWNLQEGMSQTLIQLESTSGGGI